MGLKQRIQNIRQGIEFIRQVSSDNKFYRSMYQFMTHGLYLNRDNKLDDYIKDGYEGNADVFSILLKIGTMFSQVPIKLYLQQEDNKEEVKDDSFNDILIKPNHYQTLIEYMRLWEIFGMATGNAISYNPIYSGGMNNGQLMSDGMLMMPSQNIEIKSGSFRQPIEKYVLDLNSQIFIDPQDIWHTRLFPNLDYEGGKNFYGISPIKVAAKIVVAQNEGWNIEANTFSRGIIPGLLSREDYPSDFNTKEQQAEMEKIYDRKYGSTESGRTSKPMLNVGKWQWIEFGFKSLRDLQIIESSQHGLRILCNIWEIPSQVMNDISGTTFNNQKEARKAIYTNRIIPDLKLFCNGLTRYAKAYNENYIVEPDLTGIEELQENKKEKADWINILVQNGTLTRNQGLKIMGEAESDIPGMDNNLVSPMLVPIEQISGDMPTEEETDKFLERHKIKDYE